MRKRLRPDRSIIVHELLGRSVQASAVMQFSPRKNSPYFPSRLGKRLWDVVLFLYMSMAHSNEPAQQGAAGCMVDYWQTARDVPEERLKAMPPIRLEPYIRLDSLNLLDRKNSSEIVIRIDSQIIYQEIVGFGGAFTQSSAHVWQSLSPALRNDVITAYFDPDVGIGYTIGRVRC